MKYAVNDGSENLVKVPLAKCPVRGFTDVTCLKNCPNQELLQSYIITLLSVITAARFNLLEPKFYI